MYIAFVEHCQQVGYEVSQMVTAAKAFEGAATIEAVIAWARKKANCDTYTLRIMEDK